MKDKFTIDVVGENEFKEILIEALSHYFKDWKTHMILQHMVEEGLEKLDFENLKNSLKKMPIYLDTVAVEFGDSQFLWIVSGSDAILVRKEKFGLL